MPAPQPPARIPPGRVTTDRAFDLVILDFDGTLADSVIWFAEVFNEVARRYRFRQATRDELEALRGEGVPGILRALGVARWKVPLIARHMRKLVARDIAKIALFPDAALLVRELSEAGLELALVSSNAQKNVRALLGEETAALIAHWACGASLHGKAAKFQDVLERACVPASRAIAIGDECRDIDAAAAVGIAAGAVPWGYATREALAGRRPAVLFDDFAAIVPFVVAGPR